LAILTPFLVIVLPTTRICFTKLKFKVKYVHVVGEKDD
jgi:hypothetical protein